MGERSRDIPMREEEQWGGTGLLGGLWEGPLCRPLQLLDRKLVT